MMRPAPIPFERAPSALLALELFLAHDPGLPGLNGHLVIGVQSQGGTTFWSADFTRARFALLDAEPPFSDALLVLTEAGADALACGDTPEHADVCAAFGDADLVARFVRRYGRGQTPLGIRFGGF